MYEVINFCAFITDGLTIPAHYQQVSSPPSGSTQPLLCNGPLSSSPIDGPSKGSLNVKYRKESTKQYQQRMSLGSVVHNY